MEVAVVLCCRRVGNSKLGSDDIYIAFEVGRKRSRHGSHSIFEDFQILLCLAGWSCAVPAVLCMTCTRSHGHVCKVSLHVPIW